MAPRISSKTREAAIASAPDDHQSCSDATTAALLDISIKTLQRLDAKKAGPRFFTVGSRKRRTLAAIRQFQKDNAA
jgi:hypothetical protein